MPHLRLYSCLVTLTLLLLLLLPTAAPVSRLPLLARLRREPVDDSASISTDAELASSVDSVLKAVGPLVLNLRRILAGLLLLAAVAIEDTAGVEVAQLVLDASGPMLPWVTMAPAVLVPAPSPAQQSLSIWS